MTVSDSRAVVSLRRHAANIRRWTIGDSRIVADVEAVLAELDETRRLVAGFPDGWTAADEAHRLRYDADRTRVLLAARAELDEARRAPRVWLEGDEVPADVWVQFPSGSISAVQASHLVVQFPLVEVFVVADHAAAVAAERERRASNTDGPVTPC